MCERCRSITSRYMPAILLAAASSFAEEQTKRTPDIPADALTEAAAALDLLAEMALLAKSSRGAGDTIDARLATPDTQALRRTASLAWYGGELMQSLAGMICTVLSARAMKGDGGAAEYMLTGVGRTVVDSPMAEEAEETYVRDQMSSLVNSIARGVAQAHTTGKPAHGEPEFKH